MLCEPARVRESFGGFGVFGVFEFWSCLPHAVPNSNLHFNFLFFIKIINVDVYEYKTLFVCLNEHPNCRARACRPPRYQLLPVASP